MPTPGRSAARSSWPAPPPVRASYRPGLRAVAPSVPPSIARPQSMRLPGSQPHRRRRPRLPILPSQDSTLQQNLLSLPRRPHSAVEPIGTPYAQPAPVRSPARSPPAPTNPLPESSSFSSSFFFVRRGQNPISLHATQPALCGQAMETSNSFLSGEDVESSIGLHGSNTANRGIFTC